MKGTGFVLILAAATASFAQSQFSDARGNSSIVFPRGGYAQIAFDKASARIGYLHDLGGLSFYGLELSGKLRGDSADLFSNGKLVNDTQIKLTFGQRLGAMLEDVTEPLDTERDRLQESQEALMEQLGSATSPEEKAAIQAEIAKVKSNIKDVEDRIRELGQTIGWATAGIQVIGRAASYRLFDPSQPFDSQFSKKDFEGWGANFFYNGLRPNFRYGLSVGFERGNNIDDLDKVDATLTTTVTNGNQTLTTSDEVSAYQGDYKIVDRVPLRGDLVWWPRNLSGQIALDLYGRADLSDGGSFKPGLGLFLCKKGAPTAVIGGLTVLLDHGRPKASIVAGFSF